MPSDDLILDVRQIAGYPAATGNALSSDALVMQRGGLGGPYASISPTALVGTALAGGGDMSIGGQLSAESVQGGAAQFSNGAFGLLDAQKACVTNLEATWGSFGTVNADIATFVSAQCSSSLSVSGDMQVGGTANMANAVVQANLTAGYATVVQTLGAANLAVSNLATVCNLVVDGNLAIPNGVATLGGYPILTTANAPASGLAPLDSPPFTGSPTAPTPAPGNSSTLLATTAFVAGALGSSGFAPLASPNFSGVPQGPTAAPGNSTAQLATTAFVTNAVSGSTAGVSSFNTRVGAVTFEAADLTSVGGALLASPVFTGFPSAPTATTGNASGILATTQFVQNTVAAINLGVTTFNTRSGAITLTSADITGAGGALASSAGVSSFNGRSGAITLTANDVSAAGALVNPSVALLGVPTAPTAVPATNNTQLATTAYVTAAVAAVTGGVTSFNGRNGAVSLTLADVTGVNGAPINSPSFSGVPLAPTAAAATNTNQIATCAWVLSELGGSGGVTTFNTRSGAVVLTSADITGAGGATLAAPAFTGVPTAPTAAAGTNSIQLATTAFAQTVAKTGVTDGSNAAAGQIGEYMTATRASGSAINLPNAAVVAITSLSLTAGDWDVSGCAAFIPAGSPVASYMIAGINNAVALPANNIDFNGVAQPGNTVSTNLPTPTDRFSLTATATVYLVAIVAFSGGSWTGFGTIRARRVR